VVPSVFPKADIGTCSRVEFNPQPEVILNLVDVVPKRGTSHRVVAEQLIDSVLGFEQSHPEQVRVLAWRKANSPRTFRCLS
jgi:hypothetical protein